MLNTIIKICDHTFPFAANMRDVTPMHAATNVNKSKLPDEILDITIISREPIHTPHSFFVKLLIGLLIIMPKLLPIFKKIKRQHFLSSKT